MTEPTLPNETLRQQLSAFVDGELPSAEAELLVRRLARDAELKQSMNRYLLVGEALRLPTAIGPSRGFSAKVAAALEADAAENKPSLAVDSPLKPALGGSESGARRRLRQWWAPAVGAAIAAGVAAVVVLGYRGPVNTAAVSADALEPVTVTAQRSNESESYVVPTVTNSPTVPIASARLTNYVVAHSEYSSPLGRRNMLTGLLAGDDEVDNAAATSSDQTSESKP